MPSRKTLSSASSTSSAASSSSRRKRPIKRLLDEVLLKSNTKTGPVTIDLVSDNSDNQSLDDVVTASSSMLKRHEEKRHEEKIQKDNDTSPDPSLRNQQLAVQQKQAHEEEHPPVSANSDFYYTPMYRRYFGLTPPNPRLCNPRLLEDYIDWYLNVYLEEELPWRWIDVGTAEERAKKSEQEAKEEAEKFNSISTTPKEKH